MVSRTDPTKREVAFKKKALRPWKPAVLDTQVDYHPETKNYSELHPEFLQKQLETTLNIKTQHKIELEEKLSLIEDNRITVGGFFQPKHTLFLKPGTLHEATAIMNELRKKEQEILEITHQLKLTQAIELAEHANMKCQAEEAAHLLAAEQAISAIRQAHQATEQLKFAEERAYFAEQAKIKLEQTVSQLEQQLQATEHSLENKLTSSLNRIAALENANMSEIELRKKLEAERRTAESSIIALRSQLTEFRKESDITKQLLEQAHNEAELLFLEKNQLLAHNASTKQWERTPSSEEYSAQNLTYIQKINAALASERNLRKLYEQHARETTAQIFALEMRISAETYARELLETRLKNTNASDIIASEE